MTDCSKGRTRKSTPVDGHANSGKERRAINMFRKKIIRAEVDGQVGIIQIERDKMLHQYSVDCENKLSFIELSMICIAELREN